MVVKIIIEMVRMKLMGSSEGIGSLIKELKDPLESVELRMNVLTQPKHAKQKGAEVVETLKQYIEVKLCSPSSACLAWLVLTSCSEVGLCVGILHSLYHNSKPVLTKKFSLSILHL